MKLQDNLEILCDDFKELNIRDYSSRIVLIVGELEIDSIVCDEHITETYLVQIEVPTNYPKDLPIIKELSSKVNNDYIHKYTDESLCLATEADMHMHLLPKYSLSDYITKLVYPYFVSYEYYKKYKVFPFGDRAHGIEGILEFYKEIFMTDKIVQVYNLLQFTSNNNYRGHKLCPCGSKKRVRKCHGEIILTFQQENILPHVQTDFIVLHDLIERAKLKEKRKIVAKYIHETK